MSSATRRLATIVALDVAGYSARTEADETKTTAEVAALRTVIEALAARHGGRVFNTAGDGFMLEFGSSLAAVEAALELAETCEPKVRVGVHLGDVVVQPNGDLLGHGVNVAARLMAQAEPGSGLVSADVRRTIRGALAKRLVSRGLLQLDKMNETVEAFALAVTAPVIAPAQTKAALEPILAVLPFDNLSNDPEMQFFSDGMSEEILQVLARGAGLKVIGRTSAFQFRGARKGEAARLLKATHILDGAVRKAGTRLRVSAQLTEAAGGAALWTERYDRDLADTFAVQDDVAASVAAALRSVLRRAPPDRQVDPHAYEQYLKAYQARASITFDGFRRAENLLEETVALAPDFANAWALLGAMRVLLLPPGQESVGAAQFDTALAAARRALALDPNCAMGYWTLANAKPAFTEYAEKIDLARRAVELAPSDSSMLTSMGGHLVAVGRCLDASAHIMKAASVDPMNPFRTAGAARMLEALGRDQAAQTQLDEAAKQQQPNLWTAVAEFDLLFNAARFPEAAEHLNTSVLSGAAELSVDLRSLLQLPSMPRGARVAHFQDAFGLARTGPLDLIQCERAARFGCSDLAFEHLFAALDAGRPMAGLRWNAFGLPHAVTLSSVFAADGKALRADKRFAKFCARVGLVDYWRSSGHWPDCANEVPYDFKAECEKAARGPAKE